MKNVLTILRRELAAYFTSPIGYIFMIAFLIISVGLYMMAFFQFPVADMRNFFNNLPIVLCVFIPAVTMRVWAEERKENTWEMLLTFPMKAWELVLGKYFASLVFLAVALIATFTVPLMLAVLGDPDGGAVFSGYLGALLLGALFLAIGIFVSGFCKDQIVALLISLLACFIVFLLGTGFVAAYIDGRVDGLGSLLRQLVGVLDHYNGFMRGVIAVTDIIYFLAWIVVFLGLNMIYIDARNRPGAKQQFAIAIVICLGIGFMLNWLIVGQSLGRLDMTEDKINTVSDASQRILSRLETPVQIKVYITPRSKMPTAMKDLEQDITGKLEELRIAAGGKLQYITVHLDAPNLLAERDTFQPEEEEEETDEAKSIEKRMQDKGIEPFAVTAGSEDEVTNKLVYSSVGVAYLDKAEEIIPRVLPQDMPELEYRLVNTIYKLTREEKPVVALVAPKEAVNIPPEMRQIYQQMGQPIPTTEDPYEYLEAILLNEKYDVRRVDLTQTSPLPDEYDTLVVVNPRELNDRQRWEINRALVAGKSALLAAQNYEWDYQASRTGLNLTKREEKPMVNELLEHYGLGISKDYLMDVNHVPLTIQNSANPFAALLGGGQRIDLSTHILIGLDSMDKETAITDRLDGIFYLWGSTLELDNEELQKYGLEAKTLVSTSERAWTVPSTPPLSQESFDEPETGTSKYPLIAMVSGQFPDAYKDEPRPAWPPVQPTPGQPMPPPPPPEDEAVAPVTPEPGKMILMGCSIMFRKNFLQQGNLDLFLNCVDALTLGDDLVEVRGRKPINRIIERPTPAKRNLWRAINFGLGSTLIAAIGIVTALLRTRSRNAYTVSHDTGAP